jgi:hypothetical protein
MKSISLAKSALARTRLRKADSLERLAIIAAIGVLVTLAAAQMLIQRAPYCEIIAVDARGDRYVAGSGTTCLDAADGAELPANWTDVHVEFRP